jgi:hypothetical protein
MFTLNILRLVEFDEGVWSMTVENCQVTPIDSVTFRFCGNV